MIKNKFIYAVWLILLGTICFFRIDFYLIGLLGLSLLLIPLSAVLTWLQRDKVRLDFDLQGSVEGADYAEGRLTFRYGGFLPCLYCRAELLVENKLTGDQERINCLVRCSKDHEGETRLRMESKYCGKAEGSISEYRIWDCLGLFSFKKSCQVRKAALMIPQTVELELKEDLISAPDLEGVDYSEHKPGFDPSETFSIREYKEGDRLKSIHWKLSNKLDRIMIREPGLPIKNSTQILMETCFDFEDPEEGKKTMAAVAAYTISLSEQLIDAGMGHQLGWMNYKENVFYDYEINDAGDLMSILGELLGATVTKGGGNVKDKFYEETGRQEVPGLVIIDHDRI